MNGMDMNELYNMDEGMIWHIIVVAMCWQEIEFLSCIHWSWKLVGTMTTCRVKNYLTSQL
jgi:hypothetical protein